MGFFNLYKPRTYGYRYIYYDPEKEAKKEKERERAMKNGDEPYKPTLKRGVFREMADKNKNYRVDQIRKANLRLIIILFFILTVLYLIIM